MKLKYFKEQDGVNYFRSEFYHEKRSDENKALLAVTTGVCLFGGLLFWAVANGIHLQ